MSALLVLDADAVRAAGDPARAVEAVIAALRGALDPARDIPRHTVALKSGQLLVMASQSGGSGTYVGVKVATVAPDNPARRLPLVQGSYLLCTADTLTPVAVLDASALTALRTPAVSVAAVRRRLVADSTPMQLAVIGSGPQARAHVATIAAALSTQRAIATVTCLVRDRSRVDPPMRDVELATLGSRRADAALRAADVVICATSARTPVFDAALIADRAVVIAVGSHEPDAREVPAVLCARATVVVEDVATALREAGDVCLAVEEGALAPEDLVAMRELVVGSVVPDPDRPLLFKSVGMSWQDLVIAEDVYAQVCADVRTDPGAAAAARVT